MLNQEQINGKWTEIKGGVRNVWGQITEEELEFTKGNMTAVAGLVHRKYGESREIIKEKMDRLMMSFDNNTDKLRQDSETSFERNPTQERTSGKSQIQDKQTELKGGTEERDGFDEESFDASQESLSKAKGSTSNSYQNPNREKIGRELNP